MRQTGRLPTSSGGTTSDGSESGSSSTGLALPVCGNGVVEGDETCDDNPTPGDGCQECARDSIVFISSEVYQGFALGGLYGADQRCRSLAAKAGLERFLTFKAWLSTPTMSAADRLLHSHGRYVLVNGLVVAQDWDALTSGTLENAIVVDEKSMTQNGLVWTGTLGSGQPALGSEFCEDWDDDSGLLKWGGSGLSASTDANWSFFDHNGCGSETHLYCFEQ
jgi:cysteine-rich repeat protein